MTWGVVCCFLVLEQERSIGAHVAQLVEHILGKDEVSGSIPLVGSTWLVARLVQLKTRFGGLSYGKGKV